MADYTLHLGFDWNSPRIGTLFGESSSQARFLHFELQSSDGQAASFTEFMVDDNLYIQVHCMSGAESEMKLELVTIAFGPLDVDGSESFTTITPGQIVLGGTPAEVDGQAVLQLSAEPAPLTTSPWGTPQKSWVTRPPFVTFLGSASSLGRFEMGFWINVQSQGSVSRIFTGDPEVIVGSGGSQN